MIASIHNSLCSGPFILLPVSGLQLRGGHKLILILQFGVEVGVAHVCIWLHLLQ